LQNHEALISGCRKNDRKAQQQLFEKFASKMFGHCLRYSKNEDDAKDILQEGFIKVFEKIGTLKEASQLESWMTRVFINLALTFWRKANKLPDFVDVLEIDAANEEIQEEKNDLTQMGPEQVLQWMHELPETYRMVLNMYAIDQMTHQEIAQSLGITVSNSKSILSRARKTLRDRLESESK
jgi:RNA polymerase sigma factor (sigma-70 family)